MVNAKRMTPVRPVACVSSSTGIALPNGRRLLRQYHSCHKQVVSKTSSGAADGLMRLPAVRLAAALKGGQDLVTAAGAWLRLVRCKWSFQRYLMHLRQTFSRHFPSVACEVSSNGKQPKSSSRSPPFTCLHNHIFFSSVHCTSQLSSSGNPQRNNQSA